MRLYPLALKVEGRRCVVVGGGSVAERKILLLLECGAKVVVVSPTLTPIIEEYVTAGRVQAIRRVFQPEDLRGALVAIAATDDQGANRAVRQAADEHHVLLNVVDIPDLCDFYVPASFARGDFEIAVNTAGASPVLAKRIREELEQEFGWEYAVFLELLARLRRELKERVADRERRAEAERDFVYSEALALLAQGKRTEAEKVFEECLHRYAG